MYDYNVKVLASSVMSHMYVSIEASDPAKRQRSGNWNMMAVSLTQLGYLVWKQRPSTSMVTACVILGSLNQRA